MHDLYNHRSVKAAQMFSLQKQILHLALFFNQASQPSTPPLSTAADYMSFVKDRKTVCTLYSSWSSLSFFNRILFFISLFLFDDLKKNLIQALRPFFFCQYVFQLSSTW